MLPERIAAFFSRFPLLISTIEKLNAAHISFAIGGSGCLFLFGNERVPEDADILLPDERHDEADKIFEIESYTHTSETEHVRNSNPSGDHSIQLTSQIILKIQGKEYRLSLTKNVLDHATTFDYQGQTITLLPVEDVLFIKALLQRGVDVGKHDIEDIQRFLKINPAIDRAYLASRVEELGAEERVGKIFD
ncbi:hypothetical protein EXS71_00420 [Candidatus Uhrbacteria bacterium]|nr:hypothetical protein [Candidatus Uhrbacteria bacterium]